MDPHSRGPRTAERGSPGTGGKEVDDEVHRSEDLVRHKESQDLTAPAEGTPMGDDGVAQRETGRRNGRFGACGRPVVWNEKV